jgi:hypothetical protein
MLGLIKPAQPTALLRFCRLGKQLYRLPNICVKAITAVGLDKASLTDYSIERQTNVSDLAALVKCGIEFKQIFFDIRIVVAV